MAGLDDLSDRLSPRVLEHLFDAVGTRTVLAAALSREGDDDFVLVATDDGVMAIEPYPDGLPPTLTPWEQVQASALAPVAFTRSGGRPLDGLVACGISLAGRVYRVEGAGTAGMAEARAFHDEVVGHVVG